MVGQPGPAYYSTNCEHCAQGVTYGTVRVARLQVFTNNQDGCEVESKEGRSPAFGFAVSRDCGTLRNIGGKWPHLPRPRWSQRSWLPFPAPDKSWPGVQARHGHPRRWKGGSVADRLGGAPRRPLEGCHGGPRRPRPVLAHHVPHNKFGLEMIFRARSTKFM